MSSRMLVLALLPMLAFATDDPVINYLADQANERVPTNTVAPVVVRPDTDSNTASATPT